MFTGKLRLASRVMAAGVLALSLGACAVYEPAPAYPAYPAYGYAPAPAYGYAPAPGYYGPSTSFSFGYYGGGGGGYHHRHWRG